MSTATSLTVRSLLHSALVRSGLSGRSRAVKGLSAAAKAFAVAGLAHDAKDAIVLWVLPTDHDLYEAVRRGLPGTSMPAWEGLLTPEQIWNVVHYIKTFSPGFVKFPPEQQLVIGKPVA